MRQSDVQRFYSLHGRELKRFLTQRLNCADTAADLTQEAFLRLLRRGATATIENPRAYLYRIAANLAQDHFRHASRQPPTIDNDQEAIADGMPSPERTLLAKDEVRRLEQAIRDLPARQREVLLLHKIRGFSYAEIAEELGISKNTVMVHMGRALANCRDRLAQD